MTTWLMNSIFKKTAFVQKMYWFAKIDKHLGLKGSQKHLYSQLIKHEKAKRENFKWLHSEHTSKDILEKALYRALGNVEQKQISLSEYHRIKTKIDDLKKVRFADNYDGYKVTSDLGSTKERELFKLYDHVIRNERGEVAHKLWRENIEKDPQVKKMLGNF